jgi:hypothetical protein
MRSVSHQRKAWGYFFPEFLIHVGDWHIFLRKLLINHLRNNLWKPPIKLRSISQPKTGMFPVLFLSPSTQIRPRSTISTSSLLYSKVKVKVILRPTVSRPVRPGVRHPYLTRNQFFPFVLWFSLTVSGLLMWGALSDEKSGLYFSVFSRHRQRSLSQIWVPRDSWA